MPDMLTYIVTLTVGLNQVIDDDTARDVATHWATRTGLDLAMTSTSRDEPWLRVAAGGAIDEVRGLADAAAAALADTLREHGHEVATWHGVEIISADEQARRKPISRMPDVVTAEQLGELAGVTRQRIYQYESERRAGKRDDFPAPVLDGYWLRTVAEHWAATRRTKPGPAPRMVNRLSRGGAPDGQED